MRIVRLANFVMAGRGGLRTALRGLGAVKPSCTGSARIGQGPTTVACGVSAVCTR
jgi:hypothetical protein